MAEVVRWVGLAMTAVLLVELLAVLNVRARRRELRRWLGRQQGATPADGSRVEAGRLIARVAGDARDRLPRPPVHASEVWAEPER